MWRKTTILEIALCMVIVGFSLRTPELCAAWCGAGLGMNQDLFEWILLNLFQNTDTEQRIGQGAKGDVSPYDSEHWPRNWSLFLISPLRSFVALDRSGKPKFSQAVSMLPVSQLSDLGALVYKRTEKSQLQLESLQFLLFRTHIFLNNTKLSGNSDPAASNRTFKLINIYLYSLCA